MGSKRILHRVLAILTVLAVGPLPVSAGSVSQRIPFELNEWIELETTDGPGTLHRIRIEKIRGYGLDRAETLEIDIELYLD